MTLDVQKRDPGHALLGHLRRRQWVSVLQNNVIINPKSNIQEPFNSKFDQGLDIVVP